MIRLTAIALASFVLSGCASFSQDGGFGTVEQLTKDRIGQVPAYQRTAEQVDLASSRVSGLLKQPLTPGEKTAVLAALSSFIDGGETNVYRSSRCNF